MKKGIPILVKNLENSFSNEHGTFHAWGVQFEDGTGGTFNVKEGYQPKFVVGQEAGYEVTPGATGHPDKIKYKNLEFENSPSGGSNHQPKDDQTRASIEKQTALKAAVDSLAEGTPVQYLAYAMAYYDWLSGKTAEKAKEIFETPPPMPTEPDHDKLPF
jgi:hypothetical protein